MSSTLQYGEQMYTNGICGKPKKKQQHTKWKDKLIHVYSVDCQAKKTTIIYKIFIEIWVVLCVDIDTYTNDTVGRCPMDILHSVVY